MFAIFDHLTAIVAGVILLGALLVLQTRDSLAHAQGTLADTARGRAEAVLDVVARDADNLLPATQADIFIGSNPTRLVQTDSLTTELTLATVVQDAPGGPDVPATVRYTLTATGDSVTVRGLAMPTFRLLRQIDRADDASGFDAGLTLSESLADFSVAFGRPTGPDVTSGAAPAGVSSVRVRLAVAPHGDSRVLSDQRATRATLVARAETTVRPQSLGE